jgi:hypothetical protein
MKKAAFKIGDKLEYLGDRHGTTTVSGKEVPVIFNGMKVTIVEIHAPSQGLGFVGNDEEGEPIMDHDWDGYNVYINDFGQRRIIWPNKKDEWKKV